MLHPSLTSVFVAVRQRSAPSQIAATALLGLAFLTASLNAADLRVRVQGSTTVNPVVAEALEYLKENRGLDYRIDTLGGSAGGVNALVQGTAEVGMSSAFMTNMLRQHYPARDLQVIPIGYDAVGLVVSRDVWEGGVRAVSAEELRGIYEHRIRNWKELGGHDRRIVFFNKEPGRGTWSVFTRWLYGDPSKAPPVNHLEVGSNAETRSKVAGTRGALAQLSAAWVDDESIFALGIRQPDNVILYPEGDALRDGRYPLVRPLNLIIEGSPSGNTTMLIEYLLSDAGQTLVLKHGYLPANAVP